MGFTSDVLGAGIQAAQPQANIQPGLMDQTLPGQSAPGLGGKGATPMVGSNLPTDFSSMGAMGLGGKGGINPTINQQQLPTPDFVGVQQGGTPGRPVAAAPMVPRGPGFANPGAPGVVPQSPQDKPLTGNFQPSRLIDGGVRQPSPTPFNKQPVVGTMAKPNQGIGTIRGAGRGGIIR
jgi:hypothetical protein